MGIIKEIKNKTKQEKFNIIVFILAVIVTSIVMFIFIGQKEGWHEDEIFSYGSSNYRYDNVFQRFGDKDSYNKTVDEVIIGDSLIDTLQNVVEYFTDGSKFSEQYNKNLQEEKPIWKTSEQAKDYVTVSASEIFSYWSVYYNQARDVHPPLFYMLVHTISAICLNHFSKYIIFSISLCFYIASCWMIRKIMLLFKKDYLSGPTALLYGLSMGAITTVIFQRMYMMLTFFVLTYLYLTLKILKNNYKIDKKTKWELFFTILLGFLTQYNFCIYVAAMALVVFVSSIIKKKCVTTKIWARIHVTSAISGIILFPPCIKHIFFSYRGVNGTTQVDHFFTRLNEYVQLFFYAYSIPTIIGYILITILICILIWRLTRAKRKDIISAIAFPVIIFIPIITEIAPFVSVRYIMCVLPVITIGIVLTIQSIIKRIYNYYQQNKANNRAIYIFSQNAAVPFILLITIIISTYGFISSEPKFLVRDYAKRIEIAEQYKETKLVYIGDPVFTHLKDMEEFLHYKNFLILNTEEMKYLKNNEGLQNEQQYILEIKTWLDDTDKLLQQALEYTNATNYKLLIQDNESMLYLVSKE